MAQEIIYTHHLFILGSTLETIRSLFPQTGLDECELYFFLFCLISVDYALAF